MKPIAIATKPAPVRVPSKAELALKAALALSKRQGHSVPVCQAVGIYPCY
jgi:hypothetical protein